MDIKDIFSQDQIDLLVKYDLLIKTHYERYQIGLEFERSLAEGKTYNETAEILGNRAWIFWGEKHFIGSGSAQNAYTWYKKHLKELNL
jgi:hypothetical protein